MSNFVVFHSEDLEISSQNKLLNNSLHREYLILFGPSMRAVCTDVSIPSLLQISMHSSRDKAADIDVHIVNIKQHVLVSPCTPHSPHKPIYTPKMWVFEN